MKTPLVLEQLETVVSEAYTNIQPRTILILTMSVKFRVQLCLTRDGGFVGDAIEECCRRAKAVLEAETAIETTSIRQNVGTTIDGQTGEYEERNQTVPVIPSFRQYLERPVSC